MPDDWLDGRAPSHLTLDVFGDAPLLAGNVDLEPVLGRRVVATIAAVDDNARQARADLLFDVGDDLFERVPAGCREAPLHGRRTGRLSSDTAGSRRRP
jgi:hypothetical protein